MGRGVGVIERKDLSDRIAIRVGRQSNGYVFRLDPRSRTKLLTDTRTPPSSTIFIDFETKQSFEQLQGQLWEHVATILTGLPANELKRRGYIFIDGVSEKSIYGSGQNGVEE